MNLTQWKRAQELLALHELTATDASTAQPDAVCVRGEGVEAVLPLPELLPWLEGFHAAIN